MTPTPGRSAAVARLTGPHGEVTLTTVSERRFRIVVCRGPECGDKRDSQAVHAALAEAIAAAGVGPRCALDWQSCFGRCSQGPNVLVREVVAAAPARVGLADLPTRLGGGPRTATALYNRVAPVHAAEIVASHVGRGVMLRHLVEALALASSTPVAAAASSDPDPSPFTGDASAAGSTRSRGRP